MAHNDALRKSLSDTADLTFFYMDTKRLNLAHHAGRMSMALEKYREVRPDLVILTDDNALAYLVRDITEAGTPVVYLGINANPRTYVNDTMPVTGVLERPKLKRSIDFLQDILGKPLNKCLIMFDNGTTSNVAFQTVFMGKCSNIVGTTRTDVVLTPSFERWQQNVLEAGDQGYDAIIIGLYHTLSDADGRHVPADTVIRWTSAHSPIPAFCFWDFSVGKGMAVGGLVEAGGPQGEEAAKLVKRILAGEAPKNVYPVIVKQGRFLFSRFELDRWGITLPPDLTKHGEDLEYID